VDEQKPAGKPFVISKLEVWDAWLKVKANGGAPGADGQTIEDFEADLKNNLYRVWNRMSSGSYFPPPVMAVEIPKAHGAGTRIPGIPTVADRVAQTVVAAPAGEGSGTGIPRRLLRVPARPVGPGRGREMPGTLLGARLGSRSRYPEVLGCVITLLLLLIVVVRTARLGAVVVRYAGLSCVRW
jgi:hypothetical protein